MKLFKCFFILALPLALLACHKPEQNNDASARLLSTQELVSQIKSQMSWVPGGHFMMGTNNQYFFDEIIDNTPAHPVTLDGFYMQKYLVSSQQLNSYLALVGKTNLRVYPQSPHTKGLYPAFNNWYVAHDFCAWLEQQTKLPFSLSTEAQWEYAARDGGKNIGYPTPDGKLEMGVNYPSPETFTHKNALGLKVNDFPVNAIGIHQMGGNISEWLNDWYAVNYYASSPVNNPQGPTTGTERVTKGVASVIIRAFIDNQNDPVLKSSLSVYTRGNAPPDVKVIGFRCVINSSKPVLSQ